MFLQLVTHVGGRYGVRGVGGVECQRFSPPPAGHLLKEEKRRLQAPRSGPGESPHSGQHLHSGSPHSRPRKGLFGDLESDRTLQALRILFTGIGAVVTRGPVPAARVPGLTAAQLVAEEGAAAR